jgi:hypothetical protein
MAYRLQKPSGGQPWLGLRLFAAGTVVLIATALDYDEHTLPRYLLVGLWLLTAFVGMLKEALTYGLGDRATLFGSGLTLVMTFIEMVFDNHPYSFVSLGSLFLSAVMFHQVYVNTRARQAEAATWQGID